MIEGEQKRLAASIFLTLKKKEAGAFLDIYTLVSPVWWHAASVAHESVRPGVEPNLCSVSPGRVQTL
jgi:hypothetical protein